MFLCSVFSVGGGTFKSSLVQAMKGTKHLLFQRCFNIDSQEAMRHRTHFASSSRGLDHVLFLPVNSSCSELYDAEYAMILSERIQAPLVTGEDICSVWDRCASAT